MNFILSTNIKECPAKHLITSYYIIDSRLTYISLKDEGKYYLHYVDTDTIGECIQESENEYVFDCRVITENSPIMSQESIYQKLDDKEVRIVSTETARGNTVIRKPRETVEKTVFSRYANSMNKLF